MSLVRAMSGTVEFLGLADSSSCQNVPPRYESALTGRVCLLYREGKHVTTR